jgi:hypothetical protein
MLRGKGSPTSPKNRRFRPDEPVKISMMDY